MSLKEAFIILVGLGAASILFYMIWLGSGFILTLLPFEQLVIFALVLLLIKS